MSYSKLIELNQRNSDAIGVNNVNGTFTSTIKQSVNINEGDQINIRNIFIDSKKQSNSIFVKTDTTLTMKFVPFCNLNTDYVIGIGNPLTNPVDKELFLHSVDPVVFADGSNITSQRLQAFEVTPTGLYGDTFSYTSCKVASITNEFSKVKTITIFADNKSQFYGGFNQLFKFKSTSPIQPDGEYSLPIPELSITNNGNSFVVDLGDEGPIFKTVDGFNATDPEYYKSYNVKSFSYTAETNLPSNDQLLPNEKTITITIEAGNYQPSILAQIITNKINAMSQYFAKNVENVLDATEKNQQPLIEDKKLNGVYTDLESGATVINYDVEGEGGFFYYLVSEDDSAVRLKLISSYNAGGTPTEINSLFGGCTTFQLAFDNDTNTFKIPNLHTPYYASISSGGTTTSQVGYKYSNKTNTDDEIFCYLDTIRAEMRITSLTSTNLDKNDNSNFWFDSLGLDPSIITTVGSRQATYPIANNQNEVQNVPTFSYSKKKLGINYTEPYVDSSFLIKNESFNPNYVDNETTPILYPTTDTTQIFGSKSLSDIIIDDGYFKLSISGFTSTDLHNEQGKELITSIISKYYSGQSYTNGFITDSISYTHVGAPIVLSSFNVRITDSKNEIPNIGNDNTIIIEVIKPFKS